MVDVECGDWWEPSAAPEATTEGSSATSAAAGAEAEEPKSQQKKGKRGKQNDGEAKPAKAAKKSREKKRRQQRAAKANTACAERAELVQTGNEGAMKVLWEAFTSTMAETLSDIEMDVLRPQVGHFKQPVSFNGKYGEGHQFGDFLAASLGLKKGATIKMPSSPGSCSVLVVCGGALRCIELINSIKTANITQRGSLAKLFAKHMKLKEQTEMMKSRVVSIAVGTPARVKALLDAEAFSLENTLVCVDATFQDSKARTMFQLKEINLALCQLLQTHILPALFEGTNICLY
eukprot:m.155008 g.155008  ORF g.155008 m.155008 type:complete len:290 (-) comp14303_c0_seq13:2633-3502(-)